MADYEACLTHILPRDGTPPGVIIIIINYELLIGNIGTLIIMRRHDALRHYNNYQLSIIDWHYQNAYYYAALRRPASL